MSLQINVREPAAPRLVRDYCSGEPKVAGFFAGRPRDWESYRRQAEEVRFRFDGERWRQVVDAIRVTSAGAAARLESVAAGEGFFVTTGQQPGLFGGPLLTVYKILTAIRLASHLEKRLRCPVTALFWVASDDHDWDEVNHINILDPANALHRFEIPRSNEGPPTSVGREPLNHLVLEAITKVADCLPETEFRGAVLTALQSAYEPGKSLAVAFTDFITAVFAEFDLLLVDAVHPAIKANSRPVLERELRSAEVHEHTLLERARELEAAGYHVQVPILGGTTNVFVEGEFGRERLQRAENGWKLRRSGKLVPDADLTEMLWADPGRFSPNVLLRPVVESSLFPTIAYVGGPAEISYLAEAGSLFSGHGLVMPQVFPRFSISLVEPKVQKVLERFRLAPEEFAEPESELTSRLVRDELPAGARKWLDVLHSSADEGWQGLLGEAHSIDPTLAGPIRAARKESHRLVDGAEKQLLRHLRGRNRIALEQIVKARTNLFPTGHPQERVLNLVQYLVRYGPGLLRDMAAAIDAAISEQPQQEGS